MQNAPAAARPILRALAAAQARQALFTPGPVVVAVSGGADSVALLHALHTLAPVWGLSLHVAHLDHGLRTDSTADAEFVAQLAAAYALPFYLDRLAPDALARAPQGIEAAARRARYAFLRGVAWQVGSPAPVITAHHQDDQAETLLLHLIQGSGLDGLAGMRGVGRLPDDPDAPAVPLLRPLLEVDRAALRAYVAACGLAWREDSTNADPAFLRNRLRAEVMPALAALNPNVSATLARSATLLAAEADYTAQRDTATLAAITLDDRGGRWVFDLERLLAQPVAGQRGGVRLALLRLGVEMREAGLAHVDTLLDRARTANSGGPYPLVAGWCWTVIGPHLGAPARLAIHREDALPIAPDHPHSPVPLTPPQPLGDGLTLGAWRLEVGSSDYFSPTPPANPSLTLPLGGGARPRVDRGSTPRPVGEERVIKSPKILPQEAENRPHLDERSTPSPKGEDWGGVPLPGTWQVEFDAEAAGELFLTTPQPGMRVAPLGMGGRHKRLGDLFTDHKIPRGLRAGWPIVVNKQGEVVWVCGLCLAETVRLRPATRQRIMLAWTRPHNLMSSSS